MAPDQASTFEFLDAQQRPQNSRANAWRSSIRDTFTKGNFFIRPIPFRARAITFIAALISRNIPPPLFCVNINTKTHGDRDVDDANAYRGDISGRD